MDINQKLIELQDLEQTLESQIERIYEAKEELNLKEVAYKKQLHFIRGQISVLQNLTNNEEITTISVEKPLVGELAYIREKLRDIRGTVFEKNPPKPPILEEQQPKKSEFDPFPTPPNSSEESKPAQIGGFKFMEG